MPRKRRRFTAEFNGRVALEARTTIRSCDEAGSTRALNSELAMERFWLGLPTGPTAVTAQLARVAVSSLLSTISDDDPAISLLPRIGVGTRPDA